MAEGTEVVHDEAGSRYVLKRGDEELGEAVYEAGPHGEIVFTHTEIDPDKQEKGMGSRLIKAALDDVAAHSTARVVAKCPFVFRYISEHDEYKPLTQR
ncbi:MAG: GNAT family N-acetyltransferase [Microbacteriaceae bacterium]